MPRESSEIVQATILVSILVWQLALVAAGGRSPHQELFDPPPAAHQAQPRLEPELAAILDELKHRDTCQTFYTSKLHGYDIQQHIVRTADGYELALHRLIHPADRPTNGPRPGTKKPYLLLHGLIGSSASFVRHTEARYQAPAVAFDANQAIAELARQKQPLAESFEGGWQSSADAWRAAYEGDASRTLDDLSLKERLMHRTERTRRPFGQLEELDYDADTTNFGREYKRLHRKFRLPNSAKGHVSNSLAFTLSNFGYDVWLLNLRGNQYARHHHGRKSADRDDYWDFKIDKLIREDLMASINHVRQVAQSQRFGPVGFVSYSYSSIHLLGLLSQFPVYQSHLQPVVMLAPTMFTSSGAKTRYLMKFTSKLISHNGPFPALGRGSHDKLTKLVCSLPLASKLCHLMETFLYGQPKSVRHFLFDDHKSAMVRRDVACGQTSLAVLHEILKNLSQASIPADFKPFVQARNRLMRGERFRRSVMLVHSDSDEISSREEVLRIREQALKLLTLADYAIKEPNFGHTDFLFSRRNQYLVNAEVARMAALFDYLMYSPASNRPVQPARGA